MPDCTIIIPHKPGKNNDEALRLNLDALLRHTKVSYELVIDTDTPKDPYKIWNEAALSARGEVLIFTNSDVIMGPYWDNLVRIGADYNAIAVGYLVEPGNIGVAAENIQLDFGRDPYTFKYADFDGWVLRRFHAVHQLGNLVKHERGWYMPCAVNKDWFLSTGGFDTTLGFPTPNDIKFWNRCVEEYGTKLLRVASYAYHFQNLSGRD